MKTLWMVAVALVLGCTKPNPNRCCNDEADCAAKNIPVGSQCEDGLVCRGNQCIAQTCASNDSCDPAAPFCIDELCAEQCVEDTHCPGFGGQASTPYCIQGACVACRDSSDCATADAAFCEAGACRACVAHSECASDLCDVDAGTCVEEGTIVYVAPSGSASSTCTRTEPCTIDRAAVVVGASRPNVKFAAGTHVATTNWSFTTPINPTLYGPATISGEDGLDIGGMGTIKLRDLVLDHLSFASIMPATLDAARITIPNGQISLSARSILSDIRLAYPAQIPGFGVVAVNVVSDADVTLTRMELVGGNIGIFVSSGASVAVTNSIIRDQWQAGASAPTAIKFNAPLPSSVSFTTFYNTRWVCPDTSNEVFFQSRNNIFINDKPGAEADTVFGKHCTHNYDIIKPQSSTLVGGNNLLNSDPHFANAAMGDFHLTAGSVAIDAADPAAIETLDFDGTARPQGTGRDIGAFEYKP